MGYPNSKRARRRARGRSAPAIVFKPYPSFVELLRNRVHVMGDRDKLLVKIDGPLSGSPTIVSGDAIEWNTPQIKLA